MKNYNCFTLVFMMFFLNRTECFSMHLSLNPEKYSIIKYHDSTTILATDKEKNAIEVFLGIDSLDDNYFFISKKQILNLGIYKIKQLKDDDCRRDDLATCFIEYTFKNGVLQKEISFDELKVTTKDADELAYRYLYRKDASGKLLLSERHGDAYNGHSQQNHVSKYKYVNGNLYREIYSEGSLSGLVTYQETTTYLYNSKGKIERSINKTPDGNNTRYYLYNNENMIVGCFPSENKHDIPPSYDFEFSSEKLQELSKIGTEKFRDKYFTDTLYRKIIDDCYTPVKNSHLSINGRSIKELLSGIKKSGTKYIVFEIADNYFLFYKLID